MEREEAPGCGGRNCPRNCPVQEVRGVNFNQLKGSGPERVDRQSMPKPQALVTNGHSNRHSDYNSCLEQFIGTVLR